MVSGAVEDRKIPATNDNVLHGSDHRVEHIEGIKCDVTQCQCIYIRRIGSTLHSPADVRDSLTQESGRLVDDLALRVANHKNREVSLRSVKLLEFEVTPVSLSRGHYARGIEHRKMVSLVKRNLVLGRDGHIHVTRQLVSRHLIDSVRVCLDKLVAVCDSDSSDSFTGFLICDDTGKIHSCTESRSVDTGLGKLRENRILGVPSHWNSLLILVAAGKYRCQQR